MSLIDHIGLRPPSSVLWRIGGVSILAGATLERLGRLDLRRFTGRNLALRCTDPGETTTGLVALDGLASQVLVLPGYLTEQHALDYAAQAGCSDLIFAGDEPPNGWTRLFNGLNPPRRAAGARSEAKRKTLETRWIIPTSGTTGAPKLVAHTLGSLTRTLKTQKQAGADLNWGLLYDLAHFAGLQVFLQALCGGSCLIIPSNSVDLQSTVHELLGGDCNALSATPSMWRKLLMTRRIEELPLRIASLGGEIADQPLLSALAARFPKARLTHIYASTEMGVGFSVKDGLAGFPASFLSNPPPGISLRIDQGGLLHVKPDQCEQHYLGRTDRMRDSQGWINTGDLVQQQADRVYFLGRANGSINVGGRKVFPQQIEQVILGVHGVAMARVSARRNSIVGNVVEASVVPQPQADPEALRNDIARACSEQLEDFKRPVVIRLAERIDLTSSGKLARV